MKRLDRALQRRSFDYMYLRRYQEYCRQIRQDAEPLIVFQMGKVGSTTITEMLAANCPEYELFQVHVLSPQWLQTVESQYRQASRDHGRNSVDRHVLASRYLAPLVQRPAPGGRPWKVISVVRDPVARNISAFFEAFPVYFSSDAAGDPRMTKAGTQTLVTKFMDEFGERRHRVPLDWFENHLEPVFGLDIYQQPFDKAAGYQIYRSNFCDLLLLRTEDMDDTLGAGIEALLGLSLPRIESHNVSTDKHYGNAFDSFGAALELPDSYLDQMYGSKYAEHFYTPDELARFRRRWSTSPSMMSARA